MSRGLHRLTADPDSLADLRAWQLALPPSGRFTHLTGALVHDWWTVPLPDDLPVFAALVDRESRPQRAGIVTTRHRELSEPCTKGGLLVDPPAEVLLACARHVSLVDLVVLVDSALHLESCTIEDLLTTAGRRRRGAPLLRRAIVLADRRSESPWETLLRLLHVTCDVAVQPQYPLLDSHGTELARADLWVEGTNALHEYDGEHHLSRPRQRKDLARARRIGNVDWLRRGYTSTEVLHQAVGILRDADLSLGRPHRIERIRRWHRLLAESVFTPSGQQRLRCRLGLTDAATGDEQQRSVG